MGRDNSVDVTVTTRPFFAQSVYFRSNGFSSFCYTVTDWASCPLLF